MRGTTDWDGFDDVDVVVEAAVEDLDAKRAVFRELDAPDAAGDRAGHEHVLAAGRGWRRD